MRKHQLVVSAWLALSVLAMPTAVDAQYFVGGTSAVMIQRRVSYLGTVDEQTGSWVGLHGIVRLGRLSLGATGLFGSLAGAADGLSTPDLSVRVSGVSLEFSALPWLALGAVAEARRYESDVGVTVWRLIGPQVRVSPQLGIRGLAASAELTVFPSAGVLGGTEHFSPAIRTVFGVTWTPRRLPVQLRVDYRFERFDYEAVGSDPARLEQFSGLQAGLEIPVGRRREARTESMRDR